MRYLLKFLNALLDSCLAWFMPGWRRQGNEARAALTRYYNYNKHTLNDERTQQIQSLLTELKQALTFWRKDEVVSLTAKTKSLGEGLEGFSRPVMLEIVESFFVIMVVFLGIRTYYLQPFRIPTGSMQPTLNGITIHSIDEKEIPAAPIRWLKAITHGSEYVNIKIDNAKTIQSLRTEQQWLLFTRTVITFSDGSKETVPCAEGALREYFLKTGILGQDYQFRPMKPGETLICARLDAGDMVVVNRMIYHFRKPERGETFVFDTRGINTNVPQVMPEQSNASHFIKRICGLPGDAVEIRQPYLYIDGKPAQEKTIQRVSACQAPYNATGYNIAETPLLQIPQGTTYEQHLRLKDRFARILFEYDQMALSESKPVMQLSASPGNPNMREYAALGDNTVNSKDSRYWGPVRQYNVLGPAVMTIWPFAPHWGSIE